MLTLEEEKQVTEKVGEILTSIRNEKPSYNDIVDIVTKYGATSTEEVRCYTRVKFFTDVKDKNLRKHAFSVVFAQVPCDNKTAQTIKLSDTCSVSVGVNCPNTDKKHYRIVHKGNKLALV